MRYSWMYSANKQHTRLDGTLCGSPRSSGGLGIIHQLALSCRWAVRVRCVREPRSLERRREEFIGTRVFERSLLTINKSLRVGKYSGSTTTCRVTPPLGSRGPGYGTSTMFPLSAWPCGSLRQPQGFEEIHVHPNRLAAPQSQRARGTCLRPLKYSNPHRVLPCHTGGPSLSLAPPCLARKSVLNVFI